MKKRRFQLAIILSLIAALAVACKAEDYSRNPNACMAGFAARLNAGNFSLGDYAHSSASYAGFASNASFWKQYFRGDGSFSFAMTDATTASATEAGESYAFVLTEDEPGVFAIRRITRASDGYAVFE